MSEDDVDALVADGQPSPQPGRDRRPPRFSWTPSFEATFFRSLCDSVQLGLRENNSFKAEAWERAAQVLQDCHGAFPAKSHLINKSDNARKRFRLWRGLREDPDFLYNASTRSVTATDEAWRRHIEKEPLSRALRGRPFEHEDFMEVLYPDVIGSGGAPKRIMKPRRKTDGQLTEDLETPGTGVSHLQSTPAPANQAMLEGLDRQRRSPSRTPVRLMMHSSSTPGTVLSSRGQASALTPPEEPHQPAKKRSLPSGTVDEPIEALTPASNPSAGDGATPMGVSSEKRRCGSIRDEEGSQQRATSTPSDGVPASTVAATDGFETLPLSSLQPPGACERACLSEVESWRVRNRIRWQEAALDLFFRDFCDQEVELQLKISETVLCDEYKALLFCKMPWRVRKHWLNRLAGASDGASAVE